MFEELTALKWHGNPERKGKIFQTTVGIKQQQKVLILDSFSEYNAIKKEQHSEFMPVHPLLQREKPRSRFAKSLAAAYWHSQELTQWMAGLSLFSNIKLPYALHGGQKI